MFSACAYDGLLQKQMMAKFVSNSKNNEHVDCSSSFTITN